MLFFLQNIRGVLFANISSFFQNERSRICNWSPDSARFPPHIPNGKYMVEVQGMFGTTELFLIRLYATIDRPIVN